MNFRTAPQSFIGGEVSGEMLGRPDDPRTVHGAARARNYLIKPSGAAPRRPGTEFVRAARNPDKRFRLVTFDLGGGASVKIEFGLRQEYPGVPITPGYVRFHMDGGTVLVPTGGSAPRAYVQNQPFVEADVNVGSNQITISGGHGLQNADPIIITSDNAHAIPAPLVLGKTYYAVVVSPTVFKVAATAALAALGTAIVLTDDGAAGAQHRLNYAYVAGDLTTYLGSVWYCRQVPVSNGAPSIVPGGSESYWYQQPSTGEYEVPTGLLLTEDQLFGMTYSQQGDVLTLCSRFVQQSSLTRVSSTRWLWAQLAFAPSLAAPTGLAIAPTYGQVVRVGKIQLTANGYNYLQTNTGTPHGLFLDDAVELVGSGGFIAEGVYLVADGDGPGGEVDEFCLKTIDTGAKVTAATTGTCSFTCRRIRLGSDGTNSYQVTAIGANGQESAPSASATQANNNLNVTGSSNLLTWAATPGAVRYRVYKSLSGLFGWIGDTDATTFKDDNIGAKVGITPPYLDSTLGVDSGSWPQAVTNFEGRQMFGGPALLSQDLWGTRSNSETDLSYHLPVIATDRIQQRIKSGKACRILHLVPLGQLVVLADSCEFQVSPVSTEALTPDSFAARVQSYFGSAPVQPVVVHSVLVFAAARGGHICQMGFSNTANGYLTQDICERSAHLFDGKSVVQMTLSQAPWPIVWSVQDTGLLLSCSYVPAQQILAWSWHDTDGAFETAAAGPEAGEDRLYVGVRRTINGTTVRYIERLRSLVPTTLADSWFVDCGLRYSGAPATVIGGLQHLEGKTVDVFADSVDQTQKGVASAQIPLDVAASQATIGLPIVAELRTVPGTFAIEALGGGRPKSVTRVWLRVEGSGPFEAGPQVDATSLAPIEEGTAYSGLVEVVVPAEWTYDGQVYIRQTRPLPLTVVSYSAEMAVGG